MAEGKAGAPVGNNNSNRNNRLWGDTIRRAIAQSDPEKLRRIADALLAKAEEGDMQAIKELGDRLDGKPTQMISGDPDNPIQTVTRIERAIIDHTKD